MKTRIFILNIVMLLFAAVCFSCSSDENEDVDVEEKACIVNYNIYCDDPEQDIFVEGCTEDGFARRAHGSWKRVECVSEPEREIEVYHATKNVGKKLPDITIEVYVNDRLAYYNRVNQHFKTTLNLRKIKQALSTVK
ncbi:MAG: hypothetical protein J5676_04260 [Bacteroidaceae bacterium]|nr:hypothetical protein [Bacteroidaceae bacterium]